MLKYKNFLRTVALLLSVILVVVSLPATVLAVEPEETQETVIIDGETYIPQVFEWQSEEKIHAVQEIVSLREENVKHFSLPNGTYEAVAYASAVHRLDESGNWQDIDNTLSPATVKGVSMLQTADGRVSLPATFSATEPVLSLWEDGYGIAMYFASASSGNGMGQITTSPMAEATVQNALPRPEGFETLEEAIAVNNKTSVTYASVLPQTDLQYVLRGNDVKENIIIRSPAASYEYTFLLRLSGLAATLEESGSISLRDAETNEEKAMIPAPFMYDASGNRSYDVAYALVSGGDGLYALTVSADEAWINEDGRAFPVTVDPTIDWSDNYAYAYDTYISENAINTNYGAEDDVKVSPHDIALILVELPDIPDDSTVTNARLYVKYNVTSSTGATSGNAYVSAYKMLEDWNERQITWNVASDWSNFGMATTALSSEYFTHSSSVTASNRASDFITITAAAQDWYGGGDNYGVAIKYNSGLMDTVHFTSYEGGDGYAYIQVSYVYHLPDGVYAIDNLSAGWMTVSGDAASAGSTVQQQALTTAPNSNFNRAGLFKITRVTPDTYATARYVIRCMTNNNLGIGVSGTSVVTKELPTRDSDVAAADTFYIEWYDNGFHIRSYSTNTVLAAASTASGNLTTAARNTDSTLARWSFTEYTGQPHQIYFMVYIPYSWDSTGAIVGNTYNIQYYYHWSTYAGADVPRIRIDPNYTAIATSTWDEDTHVSTVTPISPGTMKILTEILYGDTDEVAEYHTYERRVIPAEGTYYFQNVGTGRYMDVEGPSSASGAVIHQWDLHAGNQEKWIIEHVAGSGGYVRIKSAYSNLYLGINSSSTTSVRQYSTLNNYTLWKFERSQDGNLVLKCKATESSDVALAVPTTANANGTDLTQYTDDDDTTNRDEWNVIVYYSNLRVDLYVGETYIARLAEDAPNVSYSSRISNCMKEVREEILSATGIFIDYSSTITRISTWADECASDNSSTCACGNIFTFDDCENSYSNGTTVTFKELHHSNIYNIVYRRPEQNIEESVALTFVGRSLCYVHSNGNHYHGADGATLQPLGHALVNSFDDPDEEIETTFHELLHFYFTEDHYNLAAEPGTDELNEGLAPGEPQYSSNCAFGENKGDYPFTLCAACRAQIYNHRYEYDH